MTRLNYDIARGHIISRDPMAINYLLKEQDRFWAIVTVDDWSGDDFYGSWLWLDERTTGAGAPISCYELWDTSVIFTRAHEARAHIRTLPEPDRWHPLNLGDAARFERAYFDAISWKPKVNSRAALQLKLDVVRKAPAILGFQRYVQILEAAL